MADFRLLQQMLELYAKTSALPTKEALLSRVGGAVSALEHVRGGVRDFTRQSALPLIVVPDLHGRRDFLLSILYSSIPELYRCTSRFTIPDEPVLKLLVEGLVRVVFVGDLFHAESRAKERWQKAYQEFLQGNVTGSAMTEEMVENLGLLQMISLLQLPFSDSIVFLKGNHENILNHTGGGDFSFCKFAEEGKQVYAFMQTVYGEAVLQEIWQWEQLLPLCAVFENCVISHAEPVRAFTRDEIEAMQSDVVAGLTWTRNDEADEDSVEKTLTALLGKERAENAVWLAGHRPVAERYAVRQQGRFIQIHNPWNEQVAYIVPDKRFTPETDIRLITGSISGES